jgi:RNA polymerase sigma factor (sigma-70 family)
MACPGKPVGGQPTARAISAAHRANEGGFAHRAAAFRSDLIGYFRKRVTDREEAEDLAHDVLVRLFGRPGIKDANALQYYLFETAHSVFIDWTRRNKVRARSAHQSLDEDIPDPAVFASDRVLQSKEDVRRIDASLQALPERTREIFLLRRLEGMKHGDIAVTLGVSLSTVEKHVHRAAAHLLELAG